MQEQILSLIVDRKFQKLKQLLVEMNPTDIALILEEAEEKDLPVVFRILPKEQAAEVFSYFETDMQQFLIEKLSDTELKEVFDELFMDDTVDILEEMPANVTKRILKQTTAEKRKMINHLLAYPEDSAGSIMTTEYIDLKKTMTVDDAIDRIRQIGLQSETIDTCYVIGAHRRLLGVVTIKDLLLNQKDTILADIMDEAVISANTLDDKEEVANLFDKYDIMALPVVDTENRLVGIVTVDDAIDVLQEEATEDIEKMAAILPSDKSYFKTSVWTTFKSRIPWLLLLMISATFTGAIITSFEEKLTVLPALITFIPMLMNTAGNGGSQSSVTVIRALSLGDVEWRDIFRVVWKETRVAIVCSIVLSVVNFIKMILVDHMIFNTFDAGKYMAEIVVVSLTLFFTVFIAKIVGAILPMLAKKCKLDPAVMASPFITTIVDAVALIVYFNIAVSVLKI
ncbi:MAG: magnesium transporter [Ruminococcaceae bacterium]|nr:magnesium transporter [Oscillospiraceae bacterium]